MKKNILSSTVIALAVLAAPALATHPYQDCHVKVDVDAVLRSVAVPTAPVKIEFVFTRNLTDMNPREPLTVEPPAQGPWIFATDVASSLSERSLTGVLVQSAKFDVDTGKPLWTYSIPAVSADETEKAKNASIVCTTRAD
jgi:hypothetical protein